MVHILGPMGWIQSLFMYLLRGQGLGLTIV